jgi:hypothetical protein
LFILIVQTLTCRYLSQTWYNRVKLVFHVQILSSSTQIARVTRPTLNSQKNHEKSVKSNECSLKSSCDSCGHNFESKRMLMQNKKAYHKEKVNVCWNFSAGKCELGDELCWFIHCENSEEPVTKEIKCNTCANVFDNINNFMQHNKRVHRDKVQKCKNKESCSYKNCWFRHEQNEEQHGVTENILNIMEKMTQRIMNLENSLNN